MYVKVLGRLLKKDRFFYDKTFCFVIIRKFSSEEKKIWYSGPKDTYINSGFELRNEDTEKLIELIKESLKLKLMTCSYCSEDIAKHYLELAIMEHKNLLLNDSQNHYLKSYEIYKKIHGELSVMCANIETYLGVLYKDLGDLKKSEEFLQLSLANKKLIIKNNNYIIIDTLNNLGSLYQYKKEYTTSVEYFEECIRTLISSPIELNKNEQIALCYYNLSFSYLALNDPHSAITCLIRSHSVAQSVFGPDHSLTRRIQNLYDRLVRDVSATK
ncbi:hsp70 interacting protein [Plasmodium gonderi]|uniref:Hsp70 interacting protein n=1 Tax=Plasmodium gonderi TaxID=77519 RepID=A0A1Y1JMS8_PLAGO|nr:hsp70 interacting protein [Plasmodium gonderi]GAW82152.1 hsp70 interacting protein [Plasmodium gonderi]